MDAILRRALRRVFLWLPWHEAMGKLYGKLYRFLLGNDVFVSYGRRDGTLYPEALVRRLAREGLVCYYDRLGSPPGTTVSPRVLSQARNSSMLVVVAGPAAAASENVRKEIVAFNPLERQAIPIDFEGALQVAVWRDLVGGITEEREPLSALKEGVVSDAVVQRVVGAEDFVSRSRRLRQVLAWVTGAVVTIIVVATLYSLFRVRGAEERREATEFEQKWARMGAKIAARRAEDARREREKALKDSQLFKKEAETARGARDSALRDAGRARVEAVHQQRLAEAFGLANRAEALRTRDLDSLHESVRLAAESLRRLADLGTASLQADRTLRKGMELVRPLRAKIRAPSGLEAKAMAFSPDGRLVALYDQGIEVWSLAGKLHRAGSLPDPTATGCRAMAFHQGRLALAGHDGSLWICDGWETPDPHCRRLGSYKGDTATFSAGGNRFLAVDREAREVQIWNLAEAQEPPSRLLLTDRPEQRRERAQAMAGRSIAIAISTREAEEVRLFDTDLGKETARFTARTKGLSTWSQAVEVVALSPDAYHLAAALVDRGPGPDNEVVVWDVLGKHELARLPMRDEAPEALAFSPDGQTLATGNRFRVQLWDLSSRAELARLQGGGSDLAFSADGNSLAAFGTIGRDAVHVWDLTPSPQDIPLGVRSAGSKVAMSQDGRYFAAAMLDRVQVWEIRTAQRVLDQRLSGGLQGYVAFSPTGAYLAGDFGEHSWMLEIPSGRRVPAPSLLSVNVSFDRQERLFAVFGRERIEIRRTGEERPRVEIPVDHRMLAGEMSPRGRYLAMMGPDRGRSLEIWSLDLERGKAARIERVPLSGMLRSLAWSADEGHLAASFDGGFVVIRNAGSRPIVAALRSTVSHYAFSPRGDLLVAARRDGTQWVCNLRGTCPSWVASYSAKPIRVALDAQGRYAATALEDETTEVWDLVLRRKVSHFEHGDLRDRPRLLGRPKMAGGHRRDICPALALAPRGPHPGSLAPPRRRPPPSTIPARHACPCRPLTPHLIGVG